MKKTRHKALILLGCLLLTGCTSEQEEPEEPEFQPTPLIIETKEEDVTGLYNGIVSFSGEGITEECYAGALRIDIVGDTAIITMSDPVRSLFNQLY